MGCNTSKVKGPQHPPPTGMMIQRPERQPPQTPRIEKRDTLDYQQDQPNAPNSARNIREDDRNTKLIGPGWPQNGDASGSVPGSQRPQEPDVPDAPDREGLIKKHFANTVTEETPPLRSQKSGAVAAVARQPTEFDADEERMKREKIKKQNYPEAPKVKVGFPAGKKYNFLNLIFTHLKSDDYVSVKNIFDEYEPIDLGFVVNQDESLVF